MDNERLLEDMNICIAGDCYFRRCSFFSVTRDCEECMTDLIIEVRNNFKELMVENEKLNLLISEIEKEKQELFEENKRLKAQRYMAYPDGRIEPIPTKTDIAREIFEDIQATMFLFLYEHKPFNSGEYVQYFGIDLEQAIEILKKKYTKTEGAE